MSVTVGILALLEAKRDKGDELGAFLEAGRQLAAAEEGTVDWYAFKISETRYGIFDTFANESGRTAHLEGELAKALMAAADELLTGEPSIQSVDIVAVK